MSKSIDKKRRAVIGGLSTLALAPLLGRAEAAAKGGGAPNILFILADDLGYADLGVYGQREFATPHLDRLAAQGVRLTQAYSNSAVCSATRFGLITGRYQYRLRGGLEEPIAGASDTIGLPPDHPTLPSLLKQVGYRTALFGKWHLGSLPNFGPLKSGYDTFYGNYGGAIDYFTHKPGVGPNVKEDLYEGEVPVHEVGYYTDLLGDRAANFIRKQSKEKPFLLSLHYTAPHWPWEGPKDEEVSRQIGNIFHYDGGNLATYGKMVTALDASIGRVLKALEQQGLAENTIVVFTSDNGGERFSQTWPFSGQKTELLEGGIRVPALVRWPARIKPRQVSPQVAISMDWLPTLLAAAGTAPAASHPADGRNLLPILAGDEKTVERTLFWRYKANAQKAVRAGDWKYLKLNDNEFLFDLSQDQRERANLAAKHPDKLADLKAQWEQWNAGMLPITPEVRTHGVSGKVQADRYGPELD
ncbi:sulfatase-like hydrolase/transferase [Pseudoduganella buxea]|uniref:N-acetylgalactosamine-6-sulfatase n=1 Tax=Pseudoduganella buxea TaxID=1949069 RepID=A0A6I3SWW6_9BURK|nr:sulfatase-like hydrolase/transferase [Pseudoduganella buxea]MTV53768.1 sulfatase-like hydrolase/transferase [Pseudoduganella buxea]GGC01801.1 N-acetylgalactosamine-6-sulfatase [Pseudoduganella buxea]